MHATLRKLSGLTILAALLCFPARAQQQSSQQSGSGDPVADAARKAKQEKKDAPKPKKIYTDDDISTKKSDISVVGTTPAPAPAGVAAATAQTGAASTVADPTALTGEKEDPNSEKAWRRRFSALRTKIATSEQELDVLQREENKGGVQYYADPTKAMNEQYSRDEINKKAAKIEAKKKQISDLKQQFSDTEEALRKAGGDAGWSRE
jgi:chromosome segregation ATPase